MAALSTGLMMMIAVNVGRVVAGFGFSLAPP